MRISSWNVNGVRSALRTGLADWLTESKSDLVCLQEVKTQENLLSPLVFPGYDAYWHTARRSGYSGVATLVPASVTVPTIWRGCGDSRTDDEGRVLTLDVGPFIIVNAYAPHSHRELSRLEYKRSFAQKFVTFVKELRTSGKPLVIAGDLNVAFEERDLANPAANRKNAGFLPEERAWFGELLENGFHDAFRLFTSENGHYTWWSMRKGVRDRNVGWRLDYLLVDMALSSKVAQCFHWPRQYGSDHCPVSLDIDL
jgi:exodeoxyribonuclease-3